MSLSRPLPSTESKAIGRYDRGDDISALFGLPGIARTAVRKQKGWYPTFIQAWKRWTTCFLRTGHPNRRTEVGISSMPGVVLPALRIEFSISCSVISGSGKETVGTVGAVKGISPTSATFCSRVRVSTSLFASRDVEGGSCGWSRSFNGGERKEPVVLC